MATYKILYWQEIPSQIKAEDAHDDVTLTMPDRFMQHIDQQAAARGLSGADDYLAEWHWSDDVDRPGTAQAVAEAVRAELEAAAGW